MTCTDVVCGTGNTPGPKPGDPDNSIAITAQTVFGGIRVSWSYPALNPHGVAHFKLYRSANGSFNTAIEIAIVSGSIYTDRLEPTTDTTYWYWVSMVTVNGTEMDPRGPASAVARVVGQQTLETLTGRIDSGALAQSLKSDIGRINLNYDELVAERLARIDADENFSMALSLVQSSLEDVSAAVLQETIARTAADSSIAGQITTVQSTLNGNIASVQQTLETQIATVDGIVTDISAQYMTKLSVNGLVGGFGLYNDGATVEAGFDVDKFWIGRTNADKVKPFIISDDVVYLNKARIKAADIDTVLIAGNAVTASTYAQNTYYCGYDSGSTLTSSFQTIQTTPFTISGLPTGSLAGTIITAHVVVYVGSGNATVVGEILVNGSSAGAVAAIPGAPMTIAGFTTLGNGEHSIVVRLRTTGGSIDIQGHVQVTIMSGKR